MRPIWIARSYAQAIYPLIGADFPQTVVSLESILNAFQQVPQLKDFLQHPSFSPDEKRKLFRAIFENKLSAPLEKMLEFLIAKRSLALLPAILEELKTLDLETGKMQEVGIYSAITLSGTQQQNIRDDVSAAIRREIKPRFNVDPSLIAGLKINIDDWVLDLSLKGELQALGAYLARGNLEQT